ncbi:signal peptide peptidase SppA [Nitrospirillum sp. BR 11752]|uniref:signal peptide peptidase SppA n=1 Tax=Nitrospirillum sp. BR 11752 TaxID=3104293 RepID=UPI002E9B61A9|nr:signal peptide peptidase SppA [Nitrospirillum sp. BR 11752]
MRFIVRLFALIGLFGVLLTAGLILLAIKAKDKQPTLPQSVVLEFNFERPLPEAPGEDGWSSLIASRHGSVREIIDALEQASRDPKVKGLVAKVGNASQGIGTTQELRDAIARFRATGRFAYIHAESYGDGGSGMSPYYLASAFDQVWLQPVGTVGITGVAVTQTFFRGALDSIGIQPQISKRADYKTAAETFAEKQATPANREMTESLAGDLYDQMVLGIADGRHLNPDAVKTAIDHAPLLDSEALASKLVDKLGYFDEVEAAAKERAGGKAAGADTVDLLTYGKIAGSAFQDGPTVALIVGEGEIVRGGKGSGGFSDEPSFAANRIADAFDTAIDQPNVKAILFRVNSPGGSPVGSETVRHAVDRARKAGKPVVISMGDVAGSGGYWVAMDADRIVALPGTLTGSIGVLGGKFVAKGLADKLGVGVDQISRGANATIWSPASPYTDSEAARQDAMLDAIYTQFTDGVAKGRKLDIEKVRQLAKGRVYTGRQAKDLGLVDALGGYDIALQQVRQVAGIPSNANLHIVQFPKPKTGYELVMDLFNGNAAAEMASVAEARGAEKVLADYGPLLDMAQPIVRAAKRQEQVLMMPDLSVNSPIR